MLLSAGLLGKGGLEIVPLVPVMLSHLFEMCDGFAFLVSFPAESR